MCRWAGVARPVLRAPAKGGKSSGILENILTPEALSHPWFARFSEHLPDRLRPTVREVIEASEVIVVSNGSREYREVGAMLAPGQALVDLAHAVDRATVTRGEYHGLAW